MSAAPPPFVPPECATTGSDWMPLYGDRMMRSKWWRRASDTARARNVMLWWRAFRETPAGSLPDDDDDLAEAAGYGFDIDAWLAAKAEIMSAWTLCSDGRWYHKTVCEVVLDTWERASERRRKAAEKKAAQRAAVRNGGVSPGTPPNEDVDTPKSPQGQTTTDRQDRQTDIEANASFSPPSDETDDGKTYPAAFETVWKAYPDAKKRSSKSLTYALWRRLSKARRAALPSAIARYARDGHEPKAPYGAPAMEKWLERELDLNWSGAEAANAPEAPAFDGPADLRAAVSKAKGEAWTVSWFDRCEWDAAGPALVPRNIEAAKKLRDILPILNSFGAHLAEPRSRNAA